MRAADSLLAMFVEVAEAGRTGFHRCCTVAAGVRGCGIENLTVLLHCLGKRRVASKLSLLGTRC